MTSNRLVEQKSIIIKSQSRRILHTAQMPGATISHKLVHPATSRGLYLTMEGDLGKKSIHTSDSF